MATGPRFTITSKLDTCRPPTAGQFSCIRSSRVKIWDPLDPSKVDFIEHGQRMPLDPIQTIDNVNICSGPQCTTCVTKTVDELIGAGFTTSHLGLLVKWNSAARTLTIEPPSGCADCPRVVLGQYYINTYIEDKASLAGAIKGLCGSFANVANTFTGRNDTVFVSNAAVGTKYVSTLVNDFATTYWVDHAVVNKTCSSDVSPNPAFVAGGMTTAVTFAGGATEVHMLMQLLFAFLNLVATYLSDCKCSSVYDSVSLIASCRCALAAPMHMHAGCNSYQAVPGCRVYRCEKQC